MQTDRILAYQGEEILRIAPDRTITIKDGVTPEQLGEVIAYLTDEIDRLQKSRTWPGSAGPDGHYSGGA